MSESPIAATTGRHLDGRPKAQALEPALLALALAIRCCGSNYGEAPTDCGEPVRQCPCPLQSCPMRPPPFEAGAIAGLPQPEGGPPNSVCDGSPNTAKHRRSLVQRLGRSSGGAYDQQLPSGDKRQARWAVSAKRGRSSVRAGRSHRAVANEPVRLFCGRSEAHGAVTTAVDGRSMRRRALFHRLAQLGWRYHPVRSLPCSTSSLFCYLLARRSASTFKPAKLGQLISIRIPVNHGRLSLMRMGSHQT